MSFDSKAGLGSQGLAKNEIFHIIKTYSGHSAAYLIMSLLSRRSSTGTGSWENLDAMTVRELLESSLVLEGRGLPMLGVDLLTAQIQAGVHAFAERYLPCMYGPFEQEAVRADRARYLELLPKQFTRQQAKMAALEIIGDCIDEPVIDAIRVDVDSLLANHPPAFYKDRFDDKAQVYMKEVSPGYFLSVFRSRCFQEKPAYGSVHNVLVTMHDSNDVLVGSCAVDFAKNPDGSMSSLGQLLDETGSTEACEMAMSVCGQVVRLDLYPPAPEHAAFVFDWMVAKDHQNKGLGKLLLEAAFVNGSKGLGRPDVVFAKLDPLTFPVPPLEDARASIAPFNEEKAKIIDIWHKCTSGSTEFGSSTAEFFEGGYQDIYHMIGNFHIMGLKFFMDIDF